MKKFETSLTKYQKREITFCQKYSHRCLVPFYGFVKENQEITGLIYHYMVNNTLEKYIEKHSKEDNKMLSYMTMIRLIEGIKYLQSKSLIHRDLKPANILLNNDNIPFISDFETYRDNDSEYTQTKNLGSFEFASYEQFYSDNISFPTDIYSFGLIIYFLFEQNKIKFDYVRFKEKIDNYKDMIKCTKIINYIYKSCVKINQSERMKISDIYTILTDEIINLKDLNEFKSKIKIHENISEISHYLYEAMYFLKESQTQEKLNEYFFNFYFNILQESIKYDENKSIGFNNLGNLYYLGLGTIKDIKKAKNFYMLSGELNNPHALNSLGDFYRYGLDDNQSFSIAFNYYEKAEKLGDSNALFNLGYLYYNGYGVKKDLKKSLEYFIKSAEKNNTHALCNLGFLYEDGQIVTKDFQKAIEYYKKAKKLKNYNAYVNLGLIYLKGDRGIRKNEDKARKLFEKAAKKNIPNALYNLGKMYMYGQSVQKDYKKAEMYFKRAKEYNHMDATYFLGYLYYLIAKENKRLNKNLEENDKLYKKAMENFQLSSQQGSPESLLKIAILYENGFGVEVNYHKARYYYELACKNGNYSAIYKLAHHLYNGNIFTQNSYLSMNYFLQCIETEDEKIRVEKNGFYNIRFNKYCHRAKNDLGLLFLFDEKLYNVEKARQYIFKSVEYDYPLAHNNFALLKQFILYKNEELNSHLSDIIYYYKKSSDQGFCLAEYNIGYILENYPNMKIDIKNKTTIDYYIMAVEHEHKPIIYHHHKVRDQQLETSISYIICIAKFKLIYYFLSEDNLSLHNAKNYFIDIYSDLLNNKLSYELTEPIKNKITNIKTLIYREIDCFFEELNKIHRKKGDNIYKIHLFQDDKQKKINKIYKNDGKKYNEYIKNIQFIENPNEIIEIINKCEVHRKLFLTKVQHIIDLMNSYLYKPPYYILIGKINVIMKNNFYSLAKNIDQSFYEGFGIK